MTSSALAFDFNEVTLESGVYKWSNNNNWNEGYKPDGTSEIKIRYGYTCTLDSAEGPFSSPGYNYEYTRVYGGATLNIQTGAALKATSWMRVGTGGGTGQVNQSGGLVELNIGHSSDKLMVGDDPGSSGSEYRMTGGTLTHIGTNGGLWMGYEGGTGQFTVVGTSPVIQMDDVFVGGDTGSDWGIGYLKYEIGGSGVSPIEVADNIYIVRDLGASSAAHLVLQLTAAPPATSDIVLIKNASSNAIGGNAQFDSITGAASTSEGSLVTLTYNSTNYYYKIRYAYDADGTANDLALEYVPEPATLALLGLGGLLLRRRK
jgi:hypothetical protein